MKVIKIDKTEYKISAMPVHCSVYSEMAGEIQKQKPKTVEEAEKHANQIKQLIDKILSETVSPQPQQEHTLELYQHVINETNIVLERAKFFRDQQK